LVGVEGLKRGGVAVLDSTATDPRREVLSFALGENTKEDADVKNEAPANYSQNNAMRRRRSQG